MNLALQIITAALAVLGFYFLLKIVSQALFSDKNITVAIIIDSKAQLKSLDLLLNNAASAIIVTRSRRISVFVPDDIWNACDEGDKTLAADMIYDFGAELHVFRKS